ncbi:MAG: aldehyde dehydrogenase family protein [Deltaproteobacteria bacterium]|jgi:phenylacetic acid degradation protein paaN
MSLYERHRERLDAADAACRARTAHTPFIESPSGRLHPEGAKAKGLAWFEAVRGGRLEDTGPAGSFEVADEVSPFDGEPIGVAYAFPSVPSIFASVEAAWPAWRAASAEDRLGVCLESLDRLAAAIFENTFATMHTTGQAFMMAFAGSGANSLDRGLEAVVYARRAMADVVREARFERRFGPHEVRLDKRYRLVPRGVAVVITCGSYPAWNAYPAIFANLATGNPVVVKPHPATVLPVARAVQIIRGVLRDAGFDPNLVVLAPDHTSAPITDALVDHEACVIVDFTGSPTYGAKLESRADRLVFTETAGCNSVVFDSVRDLDATLDALARSLCLFSGQMCTTPQNVFVPRTVQSADGPVPYEDVRARLVAAIDRVVEDPRVAAGVCGALHSPATATRVDALAESSQVLRRSASYAHPEYPQARTRTPLLIEDAVDAALHREEHFGPIAFLIPVEDREVALAAATSEAKRFGAIASYAYSTDSAFAERIEDAFFAAGASVGINLLHHAPLNYTAAYSDYHVTGLNPAGNACLTDLAFVAQRFRIVQSKTELHE